MIRLIRRGALWASATLAISILGGCMENNPWGPDSSKGKLSLNLSTDDAVEVRSPLTRANTTVPDVPSVSSFGLTIESDKGKTYRYPSFSRFPSGEDFDIGDYTITASYGKADEEGFKKPYFVAAATATVSEGDEADVDLVATLANCMVTVDYTEDFKRFFPEHSAQLRSTGGLEQTIPMGVLDPVYMRPDHIDIGVTIKNQNGDDVRLQPADFIAKPRTHYLVTIDYNDGQNGTGTLKVIFTEELDKREIDLDLTQELLVSDPPRLERRGNTADTFSSIAFSPLSEESPKFFIDAPGGFKEVILTINSSTYTPSFAPEVDLMKASLSTRESISEAGIGVEGIWKNPDRLARLDFTNFFQSLPEGTHVISALVKDKLTRVTDQLSFTVNVAPLIFEVETVESNALGSTEAVILVRSNSKEVLTGLTATATDRYGADKSAEIVSVAAVAGDSNSKGQLYRITMTLPESDYNSLVKFYIRESNVGIVQLIKSLPQFSAQASAFAKYAVITVTPESQQDLAAIINSVRVFNGNSEITATQVPDNSRNAASGTFIISGLTPEQAYNFKLTVLQGDVSSHSNPWVTVPTFTTEAAADVPNGDFEQLDPRINSTNQQQGGQYTVTLITSARKNYQQIVVGRPHGWVTSNDVTFYNDSQSDNFNDNSWFAIASVFNSSLTFESTCSNGDKATPSVYSHTPHGGQNSMIIRTVGYSNSGSTPDLDRATKVPSNYYCRNTPSDESLIHEKGTLSLPETDFSSRPEKLMGWYKYVPDAQDPNEKAVVRVRFYSGTRIVATESTELAPASDYTQFVIPFNWMANLTRKVTKLEIDIISSNRSSENTKITKYCEKYLQEAYGAVLTVDDLTFSYDLDTGTSTSARRAAAKARQKASSARRSVLFTPKTLKSTKRK